MKRIRQSWNLVMALTLGWIALASFPAAAAKLSLGEDSSNPGGVITLPVELQMDGASGAVAALLRLEYDNEALEFESVRPGPMMARAHTLEANCPTTGRLNIVALDPFGVTPFQGTQGRLLDVRFRVRADAQQGEYAVKFTRRNMLSIPAAELTSVNGARITPAASPGRAIVPMIPPRITIGKQDGLRGKTVTLPVELSGTKDFTAALLRFQFDAAAFENPRVVPGKLMTSSHLADFHAPAPGRLNAALYPPKGAPVFNAQNGVLCYLSLDVKQRKFSDGELFPVGFYRDDPRQRPFAELTLPTAERLSPKVVEGQVRILMPEVEFDKETPQLTFGGRDIDQGAGASLPVVLRNAGLAPVEFASVKIEGASAKDFGFEGKIDTSPMDTGSTRSFAVTFNPKRRGKRNARLLIVTNDDDETTLTIPLSGEGWVAPKIALTTGSLELKAGGAPKRSAVGTVSDTEDSSPALRLAVTGLPDGLRAQAENHGGTAYVQLEAEGRTPRGEHKARIKVIDRDGLESSAKFNIRVYGTPPSVDVVSEVSVVADGTTRVVTLARVSDLQTPAGRLKARLSSSPKPLTVELSNENGELRAVLGAPEGMPAQTWVVNLEVEDEDGETARAILGVDVKSPSAKKTPAVSKRPAQQTVSEKKPTPKKNVAPVPTPKPKPVEKNTDVSTAKTNQATKETAEQKETAKQKESVKPEKAVKPQVADDKNKTKAVEKPEPTKKEDPPTTSGRTLQESD
ncbi:hypothetical protein JXA32_02340 [Candidatus Sumerlaeota bacterium]|nr:hypothetical protein [Candidatus Sumerlaeota bacterium]